MKNTIKSIAMIIMAFAVLFMAVNPVTAEAAAKKAKLNKTGITLTITDKKTDPSAALKVKNAKKAPKWTTSNKKVAAIQKVSKYKIKITSKKTGKATITCKVDGRKLKCKVTVKDKRTKDDDTGDSESTDDGSEDPRVPTAKDYEVTDEDGNKAVGYYLCTSPNYSRTGICYHKMYIFDYYEKGMADVITNHYIFHAIAGLTGDEFSVEKIWFYK